MQQCTYLEGHIDLTATPSAGPQNLPANSLPSQAQRNRWIVTLIQDPCELGARGEP